MHQDAITAIVALIAGILLGGWTTMRIRSGKSYISNPPTRVSRADDPFSFWLSVVPPLLFAIALVVGALVRLFSF